MTRCLQYFRAAQLQCVKSGVDADSTTQFSKENSRFKSDIGGIAAMGIAI